MKTFQLTRVVTRNFAIDFIQRIKDFFGKRLTGYESMVNMAVEEMIQEIEQKGKILWFRMMVDELITSGGVGITIYGVYEDDNKPWMPSY